MKKNYETPPSGDTQSPHEKLIAEVVEKNLDVEKIDQIVEKYNKLNVPEQSAFIAKITGRELSRNEKETGKPDFEAFKKQFLTPGKREYQLDEEGKSIGQYDIEETTMKELVEHAGSQKALFLMACNILGVKAQIWSEKDKAVEYGFSF